MALRYCYLCGSRFDTGNFQIRYCSDICEFKSYKEQNRIKFNRYYNKKRLEKELIQGIKNKSKIIIEDELNDTNKKEVST